jgi:N-acetylmuramoyl-L-alanine amidase
MNRSLIKTVIFLLLTLTGFFIMAAPAWAEPRQGAPLVVIDPGHGGADGGVKLTDRYQEKDANLAIALMVQKELIRSGSVQVRLTRDGDRLLSIPERQKAIRALQPALLISLHVNGGFGKHSSGYEVYFPGFGAHGSEGEDSAEILKDMARNKYLNDSVRLAQSLQRNLDGVFPRKGRGLREAPTPILEGLTIPAVVVEIGFATNPEDRARIMDEKTQRAVAQALNKALQEYLAGR